MKSFLHSTSISSFLSTPKPQVNVWWDFESCCLPANGDVFKVAQFITAAVRANGIKGPVSITAFGDVLQMSRDNQKGLSDTGISLTHVPNGGKNRSLLVDLMYWVSQNPPPAHLFLICGDRDFASVLHRLRMNNYNILLASSDCSPGFLCSAASIMWQWSSLVRGENLTGNYFNQPPDGPHASWYGRYNAPLADPFTVLGKPSNIRADEGSECGPDMCRPIPDTVMKQIRNILNSHPKGISAVDLRAELRKSNDSTDKYFFGYTKFSRFLLAMPQILKLKHDKSGHYTVYGVNTKIYGENDPSARSSIGRLAVKRKGRKSYSKKSAVVKLSRRLVSKQKVSGSPKKWPKVMKVQEFPRPYTEGASDKLSQQNYKLATHLEEVEKIIGYKFNDQAILKEALTHVSYEEKISEGTTTCLSKSYKRLRFLGDSVVDLLLARDDFFRYPNLQPEMLTILRALNSDKEKLARVSIHSGLQNYILHNDPLLTRKVKEFTTVISDYPLHSNGLVDPPKVLSDIVDSIIGAIYMDSNFSVEITWNVMKNLFQPFFTPESVQMHPRTKLNVLCNEKGLEYKVVDLWARTGEIQIVVDGDVVGRGYSRSKKFIAMNRAACNAYNQIVTSKVDKEHTTLLSCISRFFRKLTKNHIFY